VLVVERLEELAQFVLIFAREQEGLGGEPVLEGVEADGGASFGGLGAGAAEGIAAIGVDLFLGCHVEPRIARGACGGGIGLWGSC